MRFRSTAFKLLEDPIRGRTFRALFLPCPLSPLVKVFHVSHSPIDVSDHLSRIDRWSVLKYSCVSYETEFSSIEFPDLIEDILDISRLYLF